MTTRPTSSWCPSSALTYAIHLRQSSVGVSPVPLPSALSSRTAANISGLNHVARNGAALRESGWNLLPGGA